MRSRFQENQNQQNDERVIETAQQSGAKARIFREQQRISEAQGNQQRDSTNSIRRSSILPKSKNRESVTSTQQSRIETSFGVTDDEKQAHIEKLKNEIRIVYPKLDIQTDSTPISVFYMQYTNKTDNELQIIIVYNYLMTNPQFYIINQQQDGDYIFSNAKFEVIEGIYSDQLKINFSMTDIGYFPNLLIQDKNYHFFIPLTYQPVEPSQRQKQITDKIFKNDYQVKASFISLDNGDVTYCQLKLSKNNLQLLDNKKKDIAVFTKDDIDCALPCVMQLAPGEHPCTFQSQRWYDECLIYQNVLKFVGDKIFVQNFGEIVYQNDTELRVTDDAKLFIILRIRQHIFILSFETKNDCNIAFLMINYHNNHINSDFQKIDITKKQFITEQRGFQKEQFEFSKQQLFKIVTQEQNFQIGNTVEIELLNRSSQVFALIATENCVIGEQKIDKQNQLTLKPHLAFKQIELQGFNMFNLQKLLVTDSLLPDDYEQIMERIDQLKERGIIVRTTMTNLLNKQFQMKLILFNDLIMIQCEDLKINIEMQKNNVVASFGPNNNMLIAFECGSFDIEYQDKDFYYLSLFFADI